MSKFGEKLKELRKERQLNQEQLGAYLDLSRSAISMYEQGERKPDIEIIERVADFFNVSINSLLGRTDVSLTGEEVSLINRYRMLSPQSARLVNAFVDTCVKAGTRLYPYYRHIAAAGTGFYFDDIPADTIEVPEMPGADFVIGVSGDSMEPTFSDGDDLYVRKTQAVQFGEVGIFLVEGTCLVKELGASGLVSHNENYETIRGTSEIRCVGKVLGKVAK